MLCVLETLRSSLMEEVILELIKQREGFKPDKVPGRAFRLRERTGQRQEGERVQGMCWAASCPGF